ncbi:MAG: sel1 repeat family protein [Sandaracinaceae bacterium]|nr:sel1 repeat family protein [Sandaracinaceae bacterium]
MEHGSSILSSGEPLPTQETFRHVTLDQLDEDSRAAAVRVRELEERLETYASTPSIREYRARWGVLAWIALFVVGAVTGTVSGASLYSRLRYRSPGPAKRLLIAPHELKPIAFGWSPPEFDLVFVYPEGESTEARGGLPSPRDRISDEDVPQGADGELQGAEAELQGADTELVQVWCRGGSRGACARAARAASDAGRIAEARHYYDLGCSHGGQNSCYMLGLLYERARGRFESDYPRAADAFERACGSNHLLGCYRLGRLLRDGRGRARDAERARELFARGCAGENSYACDELGALELAVGREADALVHFQAACTGGIAHSCGSAAFLLANGRGVPRDLEQAVALYNRGCSGGSGPSCAGLAFMYRHGRGGLQRSPGREQELRARACDLGYAAECRASD